MKTTKEIVKKKKNTFNCSKSIAFLKCFSLLGTCLQCLCVCSRPVFKQTPHSPSVAAQDQQPLCHHGFQAPTAPLPFYILQRLVQITT